MPYGYFGFQTSANLAASGLNAAIQAAADSKAYKRQRALLKKQQEFVERMSATAHRREVIDLRAAGLNPILSATGGSGAAVPSVSAPTVHSGSYGDFESPDLMAMAEGVSRSNLNDASAKKAEVDTELSDAQIGLSEAQIETERAKRDYYDVQTAEKALSLPTNELKNAPAKFIVDKVAKNNPAAGAAVGGAAAVAAAAVASKLGKKAAKNLLLRTEPLFSTPRQVKSTSAKQVNRVSGRMPRSFGRGLIAPRVAGRGTISGPVSGSIGSFRGFKPTFRD